jgi:hypothetical protein
LRELRGNFCAQSSFWRPAVNPTGRLHCEKYISLGHKHFAGVIRTKERGRLQFHRVFRELRGNFFVLKIHSGGRQSILQGDCIEKNISVLGINISLE